MNEPVHPQLMDPVTDPEEFIASSIYWYPLLFPTRTEVLDHTLLSNGNGYRWGAGGNICSVFAHIEPDYDRSLHEDEIAEYAGRASAAGNEHERRFCLDMLQYYQLEHDRLRAVRENCAYLARTYGPVRESDQHHGCPSGRETRMISAWQLSWTLLGQALQIPNKDVTQICGPPPEHIAPAWQRIVGETLLLFAPILIEQGKLRED